MEDKLNKVVEVKKAPGVTSEYVYVSIPEKDIYDSEHPGVRLNRVKFEAGKTYKVPVEIGAEVEMRLKMFERESVRLMRPKVDSRALNDVNRGSQWSSRGGGNLLSLENGLETVAGPGENVITVDTL